MRSSLRSAASRAQYLTRRLVAYQTALPVLRPPKMAAAAGAGSFEMAANKQLRVAREKLAELFSKDISDMSVEELVQLSEHSKALKGIIDVHESSMLQTPLVAYTALPPQPRPLPQAQPQSQPQAQQDPHAQSQTQAQQPPAPALPPTAPPPPSAPVARMDGSVAQSDMILPPEASFPTCEQLRTYCDDWAFEHGYDVVYNSADNGRKLVVCGRYGQTRNSRGLLEENRRRRRGNRKCGCPFKMWFIKDDLDLKDNESSWSLRHFRETRPHNHDSMKDGTPTANRIAIANQRRRERGGGEV